MLSPQGRMSPFQQAQMFSLQDANIHNLAQSKACSTTARTWSRRCRPTSMFKARAPIGTVNSINWARLAGAGRLLLRRLLPGDARATTSRSTSPCRPATSATSAPATSPRSMGLPIDRLVLATNENDVLDEFFRTGLYRVRGAAETHETSSPSMDICKASNFERFVFDASAAIRRDARTLRRGRRTRRDFTCAGTRDARPFGAVRLRLRAQHRTPTGWRRSATVRAALRRGDRPAHGRRAQGRARTRGDPAMPMIVSRDRAAGEVLETILEALGRAPRRPAAFAGLEALPQRYERSLPTSTRSRPSLLRMAADLPSS